MRSLLSLLVVLVFSLTATAQSDYEFFPYYNQTLMEDLRITDAQVAQMRALEKEIGQQYTDLNNALLYHEDYQVERQNIEAARLEGISSILTAEQKTYYDQFQADIEAEQQRQRLQSYTEMYLGLYNYLGVTYDQATSLAKYDVGLYDDQYKKFGYKEGKEVLLQEILSEDQWKTYSEKQVKEKFEVKTVKSGNNAQPDFERLAKQLEEGNALIETYYAPERAAIRAAFDEKISGSDQKTIEYLRALHEELKGERLDELFEASKGVQRPFNYADLWREFMQLQYDYIFGSGESPVKGLLRKDRETFNLAKELAIRYDAQIDAVQAELEAVEKGYEQRKLEIHWKHAPSSVFRISVPVEVQPEEPKNYRTEKVELNRNLAFLLLGGEVEGSAAVSAKASKLNAYPLPASKTQTLEFELPRTGETTIELVDGNGKLLKVVHQGELQAGTHRQEIDLSKVSQQVFFYRITTNAGSTLLKSAKL